MYFSNTKKWSLPPVESVRTWNRFSLTTMFAMSGTAGAMREKASTPTETSSSTCITRRNQINIRSCLINSSSFYIFHKLILTLHQHCKLTRSNNRKWKELTLTEGWLAAAGLSQATIISKVRRLNFRSPRWPVARMETASALKQQYSRKFLAYTEGFLMESEASILKLSCSSLVGISRILRHSWHSYKSTL